MQFTCILVCFIIFNFRVYCLRGLRCLHAQHCQLFTRTIFLLIFSLVNFFFCLGNLGQKHTSKSYESLSLTRCWRWNFFFEKETQGFPSRRHLFRLYDFILFYPGFHFQFPFILNDMTFVQHVLNDSLFQLCIEFFLHQQLPGQLLF